MTQINRYDTDTVVVTPLNPIEDLTSWIAGLRSIGYTSDILRNKHGITTKKVIQQGSQLISLFSSNAIGLLEQAYAGPEEMSFLPLYYAILNLSKIYIVLSGNMEKLDANRYHGVSYNPSQKSSRDLLNEEITLKQNGVFPLFYKSVTGEPWDFNGRKLRLGDIYPFTLGITHEYQHAYNIPSAIQAISFEIIGDAQHGFRLRANLGELRHPHANNRRYLKVLKSRFQYDTQSKVYISDFVSAASPDLAKPLLLKAIRRYLIYSMVGGAFDEIITFTPLSATQLMLPEEIPIWLNFFHLSNVVRYNPEFIAKLANSKAWPMLLAMRKHSILHFLTLFWSYLHQSDYQLISK